MIVRNENQINAVDIIPWQCCNVKNKAGVRKKEKYDREISGVKTVEEAILRRRKKMEDEVRKQGKERRRVEKIVWFKSYMKKAINKQTVPRRKEIKITVDGGREEW